MWDKPLILAVLVITSLSEFAAQLSPPVAWLSLDPADNGPLRFWSYLIAACRSVVEGVGESALASLHTPQPLPDDTVPTLRLNVLVQPERPLVLILDDYHTVNNPTIHAGLSLLLEYLPPDLHVIVSTHVDPPWPRARMRARNRLVEIRAGAALQPSRDGRVPAPDNLDLPPTDVAILEKTYRGLGRWPVVGGAVNAGTQRHSRIHPGLCRQPPLRGRVPD
jgi:LuxR family maltose regulon positive regulatory protein